MIYLDRIILENVGPIGRADYQFEFDPNNNPLPCILVGQNGSGKSIVLSYIVNSIVVAKQQLYEDSEVEKNKVYKYRSPLYIKSGEHYAYGKILFNNDLFCVEIELYKTRKEFENQYGYTPIIRDWTDLKNNEKSLFNNNFTRNNEKVAALVDKGCLLYFPANRFEEPAWLNYENLTATAKSQKFKLIQGYSNRQIISDSPLSNNKDWLYDIVFDRLNNEQQIIQFPIKNQQGNENNVPLFAGYSGLCSTYINFINKALKIILRQEKDVRIGLGKRGSRTVSVYVDNNLYVHNVFQLSSGEVLLLNLILTILRDHDSSQQEVTNLSDIEGIVVVDEIDLHLHIDYQNEVLPKLISLFPKIQFVVTTHSPFFLMGMQKELGEDKFRILQLPDLATIKAENFGEFETAYSTFQDTKQYIDDICNQIRSSQKPHIFVEGELDVKYIKRAAELLGKEHILNRYKLLEAGGVPGLDSIWKAAGTRLVNVFLQDLILLYDSDTNKADDNKNNIHKKLMPYYKDHPIQKGIENLFSSDVIAKAKAYKPAFFDICPEHTAIIRGEETTIPEQVSVNPDEKTNLCNYLCDNMGKSDFFAFQPIFDYLDIKLGSE